MSITRWSLSARLAEAHGVDLTGRHGRVPRGTPPARLIGATGPDLGQPGIHVSAGAPGPMVPLPVRPPSASWAEGAPSTGARPQGDATEPASEADVPAPVCCAEPGCDRPANRAVGVRVDIVDANHWNCDADERAFCDDHADQEVTRIFASIRTA